MPTYTRQQIQNHAEDCATVELDFRFFLEGAPTRPTTAEADARLHAAIDADEAQGGCLMVDIQSAFACSHIAPGNRDKTVAKVVNDFCGLYHVA